MKKKLHIKWNLYHFINSTFFHFEECYMNLNSPRLTTFLMKKQFLNRYNTVYIRVDQGYLAFFNLFFKLLFFLIYRPQIIHFMYTCKDFIWLHHNHWYYSLAVKSSQSFMRLFWRKRNAGLNITQILFVISDLHCPFTVRMTVGLKKKKKEKPTKSLK